jgi:hypothetical protein
MKKLVLILVAFTILLLVPVKRVLAQDIATAQVSATIIIPLTATEASQLNFGRFFPGDQGGTIVITPTGSVMTSSTVVADASPKSPGSFFVTGESDATYSIALPNGPSTLTNADATKTMEVTDWVTLPGNGDPGIRLSGGSQTVMVGATLKVGSLNQNPKGIYTGSYQITFAYN